MIKEDQLEQLAIQWFRDTGWSHVPGKGIAPDSNAPERGDYREVVLKPRLIDAIQRLNPQLPPDAVEEVAQRATKLPEPSLVQNNRAFHRLLANGVPIDCADAQGEPVHDQARLVDFQDPASNDFRLANQFTVTKRPRRPNLVGFVNGLPLFNIELKNPADLVGHFETRNELSGQAIRKGGRGRCGKACGHGAHLDARLDRGPIRQQHLLCKRNRGSRTRI